MQIEPQFCGGGESTFSTTGRHQPQIIKTMQFNLLEFHAEQGSHSLQSEKAAASAARGGVALTGCWQTRTGGDPLDLQKSLQILRASERLAYRSESIKDSNATP